jgi:ribonuclease J
MSLVISDETELKYDRLSLIPLGGQSEIGQSLWALTYGGEILLVDAGVCYPGTDLPGVDLLLPNINFLVANQQRITALVLTNGHEEHSGAIGYLLNHLKIPRILAPRFVSALVSQNLMGRGYDSAATILDTIETRYPYQIGAFEVEWIQVNDAIADATALRIHTPEGAVVYTSSFKFDQTPVDGRQMDVARLAQAGEAGVTLLISNSAGVENPGYTPSERAVMPAFERALESAESRIFFLMHGTNTHRLQMLFDLAKKFERKVLLYGDTLIQSAVAAVITGNLVYDRSIESTLAQLPKLKDDQVLICATGNDDDALEMMWDLAHGKCHDLAVKKHDVLVFSAEIYPGRSRRVAMILDQLLSLGVQVFNSMRDGVHVSKHASQEELKLMLSITRPRFFVPSIGEGRHIMHHAQLAIDFGIPADNVFPLRNGEVLELSNGAASVIGSVEAQAVLYNRDQAESVTSFSVNERRALSNEGVITVAVLLAPDGELLQPPRLEYAALGFTNTRDWETVRQELLAAVEEVVNRFRTAQKEPPDENPDAAEPPSMRASIREVVSKMLRARFQAKPTVQIVVHEVAPAEAKAK